MKSKELFIYAEVNEYTKKEFKKAISKFKSSGNIMIMPRLAPVKHLKT